MTKEIEGGAGVAKAILTVLILCALSIGILITIAGVVLCVAGSAAFSQTVAGTTALSVAEGNGDLESSFALASLGIFLASSGILYVIAGVLGLVGRKTNRYAHLIFMLGVILCSDIFDMIAGVSDPGFALNYISMLFCVVAAVAALYLSVRVGTPSRTAC